MEISDELICLFSAEVREDGDRYTIEIPKREVDAGSIDLGDVYRVALIERDAVDKEGSGAAATGSTATTDGPQPPVERGEIRYVEIEDLGKQGDGIARVERGYVIIVPDTEVGERVKIEISEVKSNFAVGEVIDDDV
ncbi:TRAM domain-containing protein [Halobaculum gomorrense]|uniref:Predicted RNA-binding protein, contains TRAM domain n=1 Tax=Halobaculum gomorrense TaxID=43928 RepID=A0A1M5KU44_9EURY|nr:TRAM domain-containing protein [Halobaculum gomorrense]SHG56265.1 Predicted RNA-binding protein, contains TRAM domain [Halobaculum gomorrense]